MSRITGRAHFLLVLLLLLTSAITLGASSPNSSSKGTGKQKTSSAAAQSPLKTALRAYKNGLYAQAASQLEALIESDQDKSDLPYLYLGLTYEKLGDPKKAELTFLNGLYTKTHDNKTALYYNLGNLYYNEKKYDQAVVLYNYVLKGNDSHFKMQATLNQANSYLQQKLWNKALAGYRSYLALSPTVPYQDRVSDLIKSTRLKIKESGRSLLFTPYQKGFLSGLYLGYNIPEQRKPGVVVAASPEPLAAETKAADLFPALPLAGSSSPPTTSKSKAPVPKGAAKMAFPSFVPSASPSAEPVALEKATKHPVSYVTSLSALQKPDLTKLHHMLHIVLLGYKEALASKEQEDLLALSSSDALAAGKKQGYAFSLVKSVKRAELKMFLDGFVLGLYDESTLDVPAGERVKSSDLPPLSDIQPLFSEKYSSEELKAMTGLRLQAQNEDSEEVTQSAQ